MPGLLISLHGIRPENHEAFSRVPGSFEKTLANIQLAERFGLPGLDLLSEPWVLEMLDAA